LRPRNPESLEELSPAEVVTACEQNHVDYWRCVGRSPNAAFSEEGGITRCITGLPQEIFNVVLSCRLSPRNLDERINAMIDFFRSRRLILIWHVGMLTEPSDLGSRLEARGYPNDYDLTAMAIDLDSVIEDIDLPKQVAVRTVVDSDDLRSWIECLTRSWDSPAEVANWMLGNACFNTSLEHEKRLSLPRKMYLGLLDGKPVGASMLFWSDDIAGLQAVGTAHSGRGRGIGGAVVRAALMEARAMGFRYVVVLSTVEGVGMYKKVGFKTFGKLPEHSMDFR
jgi:ribosomal protein S18 acetylase RimI-like enzyme